MDKKLLHLKLFNANKCINRVFLTICFVMFSGGVFALEQQVKLSLSLNNESMSKTIQEIAKISKLDFFYSQHQIDAIDKKVTVNYLSAELSQILTEVLSGTKYTYKFEDNGVVIVPRPSLSIPVMAMQVSKTELKGKVIDAGTKKPLVGATIIVSGTTSGAISDKNGNFVLSINSINKQIEVAYMGYVDVKVNIEGKKDIVIQMQIAASKIEDIVVTGVFTRNQNTYSGAVNTIKAKDLQRTGSMNIISAISALDPSFQVLINNDMGSNPNAMPDIQMRGAASFSDMKNNYSTSPNQPLFIIDGFEQPISKVMDMDMNRVASVTLLKDATAKAIYGSKAANGVVVVETIAPEAGRLKVSYKGDLNIQAPQLGDYNLTNAAEKLEVERLAGMYTSRFPLTQHNLDIEYNEKYKEVLRGVDTDWLAQPTRVGVGQKHSINIEGGDNAVRYNLNLAYNNLAGVMKGSSRNTFEGGFNLQYRYKNLLFKESLSIIDNVGAESPYGNFSDYAKMNPYWRAYDESGNHITILDNYNRSEYDDLDGDGVGDDEFSIYNPLNNASTNYINENRYTDITNNFIIEWQIAPDLKAVGRLGITKRTSTADLFYPSNYSTLDPRSDFNYISVSPEAADDAYFKRGLYKKSSTDFFNLSSDITLNYSKQMEKHLFFANLQYNVSQNDTRTYNYEGEGFSNSATEITQARQYKENSNPFGTDNKVHEIGFLVSVNYSYDSKYLFDANYRRQASSLFGSNNRWGGFWSVGAGWNLHDENFMKNVNWLNQAKIRGSFGYTGSQNFSAYQSIATYSFFNNNLYDNVVGAYLMAMSNPDLKWQQTEDMNIGIDFKIFNRFDLTLDYYVKNTTNLLTPITSAPSIGFGTFMENLGKSKNEGVELRVNYRIISDNKNDIQLSVFGSAAQNKNKLVEINNALTSMNDKVDEEQGDIDVSLETNRGNSKPRVEYAEGVSLSAIWGVQSLGIDPYNGKEMFLKKDGTVTYTWDADDKVVLGDLLPKIQGSFGVNLDYKGFTLNAIFGYRYGGQFYNETLIESVEKADLQYNVDKRVFTERWNPETPGVASKYKKLSKNPGVTLPTSRFVQDWNEISLTSFNVGYDFRNCRFMKKDGVIERFRISLAMNELFRFSTVKAERGIIYPYAQSFIFTVQATF